MCRMHVTCKFAHVLCTCMYTHLHGNNKNSNESMIIYIHGNNCMYQRYTHFSHSVGIVLITTSGIINIGNIIQWNGMECSMALFSRTRYVKGPNLVTFRLHQFCLIWTTLRIAKFGNFYNAYNCQIWQLLDCQIWPSFGIAKFGNFYTA